MMYWRVRGVFQRTNNNGQIETCRCSIWPLINHRKASALRTKAVELNDNAAVQQQCSQKSPFPSKTFPQWPKLDTVKRRRCRVLKLFTCWGPRVCRSRKSPQPRHPFLSKCKTGNGWLAGPKINYSSNTGRQFTFSIFLSSLPLLIFFSALRYSSRRSTWGNWLFPSQIQSHTLTHSHTHANIRADTQTLDIGL